MFEKLLNPEKGVGVEQFEDIMELLENIVEEGSLASRVRVLDTLKGYAAKEGGVVRKWKNLIEKECRGMVLTSSDLLADEAGEVERGAKG